MEDEATNDWQALWDARLAAIESVLGRSENMVGHSPIPFHFGSELGGAADVIYFRNHCPGIVAVTSELIGDVDQVRNQLGNYELMICQRDSVEWGARIISQLAYYTLQAELNPGETIGIESATPEGSSIKAFLLFDYARFDVRGRKAGLLLCLGITEEELDACRRGRTAEIEAALRSAGVFPFTELNRNSVLDPKESAP